MIDSQSVSDLKEENQRLKEIVQRAIIKKRWCSTWKGYNNENGRIYQALREILGDKD